MDNKALMVQVEWEMEGSQDGMWEEFDNQWVMCLGARGCRVQISDNVNVIGNGWWFIVVDVVNN